MTSSVGRTSRILSDTFSGSGEGCDPSIAHLSRYASVANSASSYAARKAARRSLSSRLSIESSPVLLPRPINGRAVRWGDVVAWLAMAVLASAVAWRVVYILMDFAR